MKINKKGFTLIELLAVIVVTSLVLGLSSYGIINAYSKSKEKVIVLNDKSILEAARIQSSEVNSDDSSIWRTYGNDSEVFCTTIQRLKNAGLLKKEATSEEHGDDTIITVERNNKTFNVTDTSFLDDSDTTLSDLCDIRFYTIHYEYNVSNENGKVPKNQKREVSQPTNLSSFVPQRKGYLFVGWNSEPKGTGLGNYSAGDEFTYDSENTITLYAQWQLNTYTIEYYLGNNNSTKGATKIGSSSCIPSDKKCSLTHWEDLHAATPFEDKGWTFAGWSTNKDSTNVNYIDGYANSFSNTKGSVIKLYAIFTRKLKFYSGLNSATVKEGEQRYNPYCLDSKNCTNYYTSVNIPTGESLSTYNWAYIGYTTVSNVAGSAEYMQSIDKDIYTGSIRRYPEYEPKLYAMYERNITLKFDKNGGSGSMSNMVQNQYYNTGNVITKVSFSLPSCTYTKSGYTFGGWNTKKDGTGTTYNAGTIYSVKPSITTTSTTYTLYAKWTTNNYSIIFDSNSNGEATGDTQPMGCKTGTTYTLTSNGYTWTGHEFLNWNTKADGTGTTYANGASVRNLVSSGSMTLYAQWQDNTYTITFKLNGASSIGEQSKICIKGQSCDLPSITRTGYEIIGWGTSSSSTSPVNNQYTGNSNITLYAITRKQFIIKYNANGSGLEIDNPQYEGQTCTGTNSLRTCSCYVYNTNNGCTIFTPKIASGISWDNGYYYSTNQNEASAYVSGRSGILYAGATISSEYISNNTTYFVAYKKVKATFKPNGAKLDGGTSDITKTCNASLGYEGQTSSWTNEHTKCSVTAPTITRDGYGVVGYNTTQGATSAIFASGGTTTLGENKTYYAITQDTTPPTKPVINNPYSSRWYNKADKTAGREYILTLTTTETGSGVAYWQYSYDPQNDGWITYSDSAMTTFRTTPFSAERNQNVYIRACDVAGNCSESSSTLIRIDKTAPTLSFQMLNGSTGVGSSYYSSTPSDSIQSSTFEPSLRWTANDPLKNNSSSGVNPSGIYYWNPSKSTTLDETLTSNPLGVTGTQNGSNYIFNVSDIYWGYRKFKIRVCDNANNCSEDTKYFKYNTSGGTYSVTLHRNCPSTYDCHFVNYNNSESITITYTGSRYISSFPELNIGSVNNYAVTGWRVGSASSGNIITSYIDSAENGKHLYAFWGNINNCACTNDTECSQWKTGSNNAKCENGICNIYNSSGGFIRNACY